ncbi:single-stranded DNA-binding protein [Nocardioides phosphati]|uniref:Single-stranded DNA-binding protein n=1 Tax=Nocardioides phosphati TaxID=1867775 RepID=A0ABQ2NFN1_9ACTN|nr:single-stranded DNA-binding protein [Nocardioides phosphati]GGO94100.1 single-stranded DNA-binding protein [Nocardioides phosphati]
MSTVITFSGNLVADPELRFTPSGTAVLEFRALVNRRAKNAAGDWHDADPTAHNVKVWGQQAENLAESAGRGDRVLVHGLVETESWEKDGEKRTKDVVTISERFGDVGLSTKRATVKATKVTRSHSASIDDAQAAIGGDPWAVPVGSE